MSSSPSAQAAHPLARQLLALIAGTWVPVDTGMMRGRDVLIQIAVLPVSLAVAGTLIGLIWTIVR